MKRKANSGDEQDALYGKRWHRWRAGERKQVKRKARRRERRDARRQARDETDR